jgi:hypothetical protein
MAVCMGDIALYLYSAMVSSEKIGAERCYRAHCGVSTYTKPVNYVDVWGGEDP